MAKQKGWGPKGLAKGEKTGQAQRLGHQRDQEPGTSRTQRTALARANFSQFLLQAASTLPRLSKACFLLVVRFTSLLPSQDTGSGCSTPFPSRRVARVGREEAGLRLTRGGKAPTPGVGGGVQSWPSPKGPPLLRRSLRPALLSPAPLSGVRARAGAGRGYELQDLGGGMGWGFSTAASKTRASSFEGTQPLPF